MSDVVPRRIRTIAMDALERELSWWPEMQPPTDFIDINTAEPLGCTTDLAMESVIHAPDVVELANLLEPRGIACGRGFSERIYHEDGIDPHTLVMKLRFQALRAVHHPMPDGDLSARWAMVQAGLSLCVGIALISFCEHPIRSSEREARYRALLDREPHPSHEEFIRHHPPSSEADSYYDLLEFNPDIDIVDDGGVARILPIQPHAQ